jgi:RNA polymerase sigma factor (sigma-70 family)
MMEDSQLLGRYLEDRSQKAFAELVGRHVDMVYFAALRRVGGDRHLAEEVTQSVFADFARKAPSLKTRAVLTGWLYTSTRFAAAQAVRTERRRRTHEQEAHTMNELHASPEPGWDQLRPIIDEVMDELNEPDREAVLLRFFENLTLAEIGTKFSLSPNAARMRIDRALDKLRRLLARRGIPSTSVALAEIFASQSGAAAPSGLVARIVGTVLSPAVPVTAVMLRMWKIMTGVAVAAIGTGLVVYEANHTQPPAISSGPVHQISSAGQNPIDPTDPAGSSSQAADNPGFGPPSPSSVETKPQVTRIQFLQRMNTDPQFRASMIALARSRLGLLYGPLFKNLNLSADRLERFKDFLVEKELTTSYIYEALDRESVEGEEYKVLYHQLDYKLSQDIDANIEVFLTKPEYEQYLDYGEDFAQWVRVNEVARVLQPTDTPLTDEQAKRLVVLFRGGRPKDTGIGYTDMAYATGIFLWHSDKSKITASMVEEAKEILSPQQMEGLRQVQAAWGKKWL